MRTTGLSHTSTGEGEKECVMIVMKKGKEKKSEVWSVIAERDVFSPLVLMDKSGMM